MTEIAVVMPCFNNEEGLLVSLKSIESKYPTAVVVVDDGSTITPQEKVLREALPSHIELHLLLNEKNKGIERSLNKGLKFAKEQVGATYIARLDAGDTCHPERLNFQKEYLDQHENIGLLGTWVQMVDMERKPLFIFSAPLTHEAIAKQMYLNNCFIHPSVMFRAAAIDQVGYYALEYKAAEDYEYFFRFIKKAKVAITDQVLLVYEINPNGISLSKRKLQIRSRNKVILTYFDYSLYALLGLVKNSLFLALPYSWVTWIKKRLY